MWWFVNMALVHAASPESPPIVAPWFSRALPMISVEARPPPMISSANVFALHLHRIADQGNGQGCPLVRRAARRTIVRQYHV
jgi:hypothetical protein